MAQRYIYQVAAPCNWARVEACCVTVLELCTYVGTTAIGTMRTRLRKHVMHKKLVILCIITSNLLLSDTLTSAGHPAVKIHFF